MKIKKSFPLKLLAFLLAVICLAGCAVLACYQIMEIDLLWGSTDATSSRQIHRLMRDERYDIVQMLELRADTGRTALEDALLEELEARFAPANTNLRWQIRSRDDDTLLYSNIDGELTADAYAGYWHWFSLGTAFNATSGHKDWQSYADDLYSVEEQPAQIRTENWEATLSEAVDRWRSGDHTLDPDTVYLNENGYSCLLVIEDSNGLTVYAPTIRAVMETNLHGFRYNLVQNSWLQTNSNRDVYIYMWLDRELSANDHYLPLVNHARFLQTNRIPLLAITAGLALVWFILTICLCAWSGWRKGHDEVSLCWFHRIPGDLLLAAYIFAGALLAILVVDNAYYLWEQLAYPLWAQLTVAGLVGGAAAILLTSFLLTLCARCKGRVLLRNMIVVRVIVGFVTVVAAAVRSIPLIWKVALGGAVYLALSFIFILSGYDHPFWFVVWVLLTLGCLVYLGWWAYHWKKIRQATEEIIDGIIDCHIDTDFMPRDLRDHANELNHLNEAIAEAVDERLRSEHFKAELITNVSHDLKTPLTSIINYVDLLKKEEIDNPKAAEYIEVLDRKSQRLKRLTEDLVEASKASTGNLTVEPERLDLVQFTDQALAEYQQRLEAQRLSVVRTLPAQPIWVTADGRHLWRIMDNLLSNCAKYALEGTRVYVEAEQHFDCAELSIKNISREALNIDPSDLMERFVRGDESRTTEGSGLGLSIARSLTDLQDGCFFISIDGDLFKATIRLPRADFPHRQ